MFVGVGQYQSVFLGVGQCQSVFVCVGQAQSLFLGVGGCRYLSDCGLVQSWFILYVLSSHHTSPNINNKVNNRRIYVYI